MRFLRLMHGKGSIFKKVRLGFTLLKSSFRSVFFSHQHYFLFCIALTAIQLVHLQITGLIHRRLTPSILMTELLAGENFFEILWHDGGFTLTPNNLFTFLNFIALLYLQIIMIFFVLSAIVHYSFNQQKNSQKQSILLSFANWRGICGWGLIELCAQGSSALLGYWGALLYFVWNIITIFDIQILSLERANVYQVLKKSLMLFKQTYSEIVALDVIIEGLLIIIGLGLFAISQQDIPSFSLVDLGDYNEVVVSLILYLISTVMVFEAVVFTNLYKSFGNRYNLTKE